VVCPRLPRCRRLWPRPGALRAARGPRCGEARLLLPGPAIAMARPGIWPGSRGAALLSCLRFWRLLGSGRAAPFSAFLLGPAVFGRTGGGVPGPVASASRPGFPPSSSAVPAMLKPSLEISLLVGPAGRGPAPRPQVGLRPCAHGVITYRPSDLPRISSSRAEVSGGAPWCPGPRPRFLVRARWFAPRGRRPRSRHSGRSP